MPPDSQGNALPGEPGYTPPPAGIINQTTPASGQVAGFNASQATASQATATPYDVAPNQTVATNLNNIVADDSPLLQQARRRAMDTANARGLLNSSIAASAGESAVLDAALPIAQQDAATYNQAATNTANAKNQASLTNAQLSTGVAQSNAASVNVAQAQTADAANKAQLQKTAGELQTQLANIQSNTTLSVAEKQSQTQQLIDNADNATKVQLVTMQAANDLAKVDATGQIQKSLQMLQGQNSQLLQASSSASALYQSALQAMTSITTDPNIVDKTTALNNSITELNAALQTLGGIQGLNLAAYVNFS
jgi:hypothetical protein